MAKVKIEYEYRSNYVAYVEIPDTEIAEVLEEWKADNDPGWEPTENDANEAIHALVEDGDFDLDPTCDEEIGWGASCIENVDIVTPYHIPTYAELNPEIPGQQDILDQIHMGNEVL